MPTADQIMAQCIRKCSEFIHAGQKIGYDYNLSDECNEESKYHECVKWAKMDRIVIKTGLTDAQVDALKVEIVKKGSHTEYQIGSGEEPHSYPKDLEPGYYDSHEIEIKWPEPFKSMKNSGIRFGSGLPELPAAPGNSAKFPWSQLSDGLKNDSVKLDGYYSVTGSANSVKVTFDLAACTQVRPIVEVKYKKTDVDFDVFVHMSDSKSLIPLSVEKIKKAMQGYKGIEFVKDVNPITVEYKASGKVTVKFAVGFAVRISDCRKLTYGGCSSKSANWDGKTACKCKEADLCV